jgi:cytochrome bd-type quinol oxidase subunit 1
VANTLESGRPSGLWYLIPILFGILGGIAAYLMLKDRDKDFAKKLLIVGIVMTVIWVVVIPIILTAIVGLSMFGVFTPA